MTTTVRSNTDGSITVLNGAIPAINIDTAGKVSFPQNVQTWQNVSGSRSSGVDYVNNTGMPITISVQVVSTVNGATDLTILIAALQVFYGYIPPAPGTQSAVTGVIVVPADATYRATWTAAASGAWCELRN